MKKVFKFISILFSSNSHYDSLELQYQVRLRQKKIDLKEEQELLNQEVLEQCRQDTLWKFEKYRSNPNSTGLLLIDWTRRVYIIKDEEVCWYLPLSKLDEKKEEIYNNLIKQYEKERSNTDI